MQVSDEILVLSVKEQKLKHWLAAHVRTNVCPFCTPQAVCFPFSFWEAIVCKHVSLICASKLQENPRIWPLPTCASRPVTQSSLSSEGAPEHSPSHTDAEISHLRRCLRKKQDLHNLMWSAQQGCNPDVQNDKIYANQPWARLRLQKMTDSTDVLHYFNQTSTG